MNKTKKLLLSALLLASTIVLGRILSIRTPIIIIGFSFVPIMLSGMILGWKSTTFISTSADIIGAILFPSGSYFIGFTITAFFTGLIYGILLYDKKEFQLDKKFIVKLILSTLLVTFLLNGILNTIWIVMITKGASKIVVPIRLIKQLIMVPIKVFTILSLAKIFEPKLKELTSHD